MNVCIVGGTGLISTAMTRKLLERGHRVAIYNRGKSEVRFSESPNLEVIVGDRKDRDTFEATFADRTFDVVVDMIAFHPDDTASDLRAFSGRCGQFIHCSTVCVYSGPPTQIPTTESEPFHSIGGYGKNKIAIEEMLFAAYRDSKFPATIVRPSHSYGEGGSLIRPFGPANTFIDRIRKGLPIVVPGDGTGLWASCHVDDVAEGFIGLMDKPVALGEAYNVTGDEWMTWNSYHEQVAEVAGGSFDPVYIPTDILVEVAPKYSGGLKEIFAWTSIFSNDKIKRDGGWPGQTISWREGAKRTIDWTDTNGKNAPVPDGEFEDALIAAWRAGKASGLPQQA